MKPRRVHTWVDQNNHLSFKISEPFQKIKRRPTPKLPRPMVKEFPTNDGPVLYHPYPFLLMHMRRSSPTSTNRLGVNIPEVCVFDKCSPLTVLYSEDGHVRDMKQGKATMKEVHTFFKCRWQDRKVLGTAQEQIVAYSDGGRVQLMSDIDLYIVCQHQKRDPFYQHILYLRNKLTTTPPQITVEFQSRKSYNMAGTAVHELLTYKNETDLLRELGERRYLQLCNEKIALFLNFEHNIRIHRASFVYARNEQKYYLVDVKNLDFTNFTGSIRQHEAKMLQIEKDRVKILFMSPEKQKKIKPYEKKPRVGLIESELNQKIRTLSVSLNLTPIRPMTPKKSKTLSKLEADMQEHSGKRQTRARVSRPSRMVRKWFRDDM